VKQWITTLMVFLFHPIIFQDTLPFTSKLDSFIHILTFVSSTLNLNLKGEESAYLDEDDILEIIDPEDLPPSQTTK
jgi:hypothetical protein